MVNLNILKDSEERSFNKIEKIEFEKTRPIMDDIRFWPSYASIEYYPGYVRGNKLIEQNKVKVVGGACLRASFWAAKGEHKTNYMSGKNILKMKAGNAIEEQQIDIYRQDGILFEPPENKDNEKPAEIKFENFIDKTTFQKVNIKNNNTMKMSGKVDCFLVDKNKVMIGVEVKSSYSYWFVKNVSVFPKIINLLQTMLYLHKFQADLNPDEKYKVEYFKMRYIDRGAFDNFVHSVYLTTHNNILYPVINEVVAKNITLKAVYERYLRLNNYLLNNEVPPMDFQPVYTDERFEEMKSAGQLTAKKCKDRSLGVPIGDFACSYCSYRTKCNLYEENRL